MPASPPLAIDLTRLLAGVSRDTPRGIDRVEMLYARHFLSNWTGDCYSVLGTPWGPRWFTRRQAERGVACIEAWWGEGDRSPSRVGRVAGAARQLVLMPKSLGRAAAGLPPGTVYLNVGHFGLSTPEGLGWLHRRPDVWPVFMLHDLIPAQQPRYVTATETQYFDRILQNMTVARGVILNSHSVASGFSAAASGQRARILVSPLPVDPAFERAQARRRRHPPYFVTCGQMDARKNLELLVDVWKQLSADGPPPAQLVMVGAVGDGASDLVRRIRTWDPRSERIRIVQGLTTAKLRTVMEGASALLAPSSAEGFNLPMAEALTLGTPVIASDLPVHRETGQGRALYLAPYDVTAWVQALRRLRDVPGALEELEAEAAAFRPITIQAYFGEVEQFLTSLRDTAA